MVIQTIEFSKATTCVQHKYKVNKSITQINKLKKIEIRFLLFSNFVLIFKQNSNLYITYYIAF